MKQTLKMFIFFAIFFSSFLCANEVKIYSQQKYNLEYDKQTVEVKNKINQEYKTHQKLSTVLEQNQMKNNSQLKVIKDIAMVQLWSNEVLKNYQPTQKELQELYTKTKSKLSERYKLSSIKVQYKSSANKIMESLVKIKDPKKKFDAFKENVQKYSIDIKIKNNQGQLGWIEEKQLKPEVKKALEKTKKDDIVKVMIEDDGWQVLYVEDYSPTKDATFEEAKPTLINLAKQLFLQKEIGKLVK